MSDLSTFHTSTPALIVPKESRLLWSLRLHWLVPMLHAGLGKQPWRKKPGCKAGGVAQGTGIPTGRAGAGQDAAHQGAGHERPEPHRPEAGVL